MPLLLAFKTPTPPAWAAANGFTKRLFYDDFTSNKWDANNTYDANTYTWMCSNFPATGLNRFTPDWANFTPLSGTQVSYGADGITILPTQPTFGWGASTMAWNGSALVGQSFPSGGYIKFRKKFDPNGGSADPAAVWPVTWAQSTQFMSGQSLAENSAFTELDLMEFLLSGVYTPSFEIWRWGHAGADAGVHNNNNPYNFSDYGLTLDDQFHTYEVLWLTMAMNGGTGTRQLRIDGVDITGASVSYSATGMASPGADGGGGNVNGLFSEADAQTYVPVLGAGNSWPVTWREIEIWNLP